MYMSRVEIDTKNISNFRKLTHVGAYHSWVEESFPSEVEQNQRLRHLWRIDYLKDRKYLILVSENKPDMKKLEKYGVSGSAVTKKYDNFLNSLKDGQILNFRLVANPVHVVSKNGRHYRYPHITIDQQKNWLSSRAEKKGFRFLRNSNDNISSNESFEIIKRDKVILKKGSKNIKLSRVSFEGLLEITDVDLFRKMLIDGIGKEKAFGMGLMTVIPRR